MKSTLNLLSIGNITNLAEVGKNFNSYLGIVLFLTAAIILFVIIKKWYKQEENKNILPQIGALIALLIGGTIFLKSKTPFLEKIGYYSDSMKSIIDTPSIRNRITTQDSIVQKNTQDTTVIMPIEDSKEEDEPDEQNEILANDSLQNLVTHLSLRLAALEKKCCKPKRIKSVRKHGDYVKKNQRACKKYKHGPWSKDESKNEEEKVFWSSLTFGG